MRNPNFQPLGGGFGFLISVKDAFDRGFTRDGGHGIGLALCREIAEYHGGRVWIDKNGPDRGITVSLALPAYQEARMPQSGARFDRRR